MKKAFYYKMKERKQEEEKKTNLELKLKKKIITIYILQKIFIKSKNK